MSPSTDEAFHSILQWNREFRQSLDYWHVYIHDPDEHVLLNTFGKLPPANIVVLRTFDDDIDADKCRFDNCTFCPKAE